MKQKIMLFVFLMSFVQLFFCADSAHSIFDDVDGGAAGGGGCAKECGKEESAYEDMESEKKPERLADTFSNLRGVEVASLVVKIARGKAELESEVRELEKNIRNVKKVTTLEEQSRLQRLLASKKELIQDAQENMRYVELLQKTDAELLREARERTKK